MLQGEGDIAELGVHAARVLGRANDPRQCCGIGLQAIGVGRRDRNEDLCGKLPVWRGRDMLLHDDGSIRAAEAEGIDDGGAGSAGGVYGPGTGFGLENETVVEHDARIEAAEVGKPGQSPVFQRKQHVDDPGNPRRWFQMADIRLHRTNRAGRRLLVALSPQAAESLLHALHLDRVAEFRAGSMHLDIGYVVRREFCVVECAHDEVGLRRTVRSGEGSRLAAMIDRRAFDDAVNVVAVAQRRLERLQQHNADAFRPHVAIRIGIEGATLPGRRQHAELPAHHKQIRRQEEVDAAGQGKVAFAVADGPNGIVKRDEAARAGCIDRLAGTMHVQEKRYPVGNHCMGAAGQHLCARHALLVEKLLVVLELDAGENADRSAGLPIRVVARIPERLPCRLQEQAMLRVHEFGLIDRDAKELGREKVLAVDEAAPSDVGAAGIAQRIARQGPPVPAPLRNFADAIPGAELVGPELLLRRRVRQPARQADNGDVAAAVGLRRGGPGARLYRQFQAFRTGLLFGDMRAQRLQRRVGKKRHGIDPHAEAIRKPR